MNPAEEELREIILVEAAGITCGVLVRQPATHVGHELIAAGMLILAGGARVCHSTTPSWSGGHGWALSAVPDHSTGSGNRLVSLAGLKPSAKDYAKLISQESQIRVC
jgi:hypothetical protein